MKNTKVYPVIYDCYAGVLLDTVLARQREETALREARRLAGSISHHRQAASKQKGPISGPYDEAYDELS